MKHSLLILLSLVLLAGCDDFLKKEIEVKTADTSPKVVVTSALEDSLFYIYISLSSPLSKRAPAPQPVDKALVELFEGDKLILKLTDRGDYPTGGRWEYLMQYQGKLPFAVRTNIRVTPGLTYTLKVTVEGYPPVSSTVVAPSRVNVFGQPKPDYSLIVKSSEQTAYVNNYLTGSCPSFFPIKISLVDQPETKDYYMLEAFESINDNTAISDMYTTSQRMLLATTDRALIQDNPDVVADQWLSEAEVNTFAFEQLIVSDLSFDGQMRTLNLLMSSCGLNANNDDCERLYQYYPEHRINKIRYKLYVLVRHLNEASYHYYRTFALQRVGLDYFSEPVSLISNIEGGYGCFAVCTTTKVLLDEYNVCYFQ